MGERPELAVDSREHARNVVLVRHVARDRDRLAAGCPDGRDYAVRGVATLVIVHRHVEAARRGELCGGGTDTAAAAGDEENRCRRHVLSLLTMVRVRILLLVRSL